MYNNPYMYGGAGAGMNFGTNPYYSPYMQAQQFQPQQQTQQAQPQAQPQQPTQQPTAINTNKIYVNGINDVKTKLQSANSDVFYFDNDNPSIIYEKIVDGTGHFEVKTFSLSQNKPVEPQNTPDMNTLSNYVLKADLEPLNAKIEALADRIKKLDVQNQINSIKRDKPTNKAE